MANDVIVIMDEAAVKAVLKDPGFRAEVQRDADDIAADARGRAPRKTGAGAASIRGEAVMGPTGWEGRVSWDTAHAYMHFQRSHAVQDAAYQVLGK